MSPRWIPELWPCNWKLMSSTFPCYHWLYRIKWILTFESVDKILKCDYSSASLPRSNFRCFSGLSIVACSWLLCPETAGKLTANQSLIKGSYEPTREYETTSTPSPPLRALLYRPPPPPHSASNFTAYPSSNAVPMGKAGEHYLWHLERAKIYVQSLCSGQGNYQEKIAADGRKEWKIFIFVPAFYNSFNVSRIHELKMTKQP